MLRFLAAEADGDFLVGGSAERGNWGGLILVQDAGFVPVAKIPRQSPIDATGIIETIDILVVRSLLQMMQI